jgi:hypothetical protein
MKVLMQILWKWEGKGVEYQTIKVFLFVCRYSVSLFLILLQTSKDQIKSIPIING